MNTPFDHLKEIAIALHKAQGQISHAKKDSTNPHFKSRYADLASVWDAAKPALQANGISAIQTFSGGETGETVTITTTLLHVSGQSLSSNLTLRPTKPDPQGIGSAITYGRRYGLAAILGIVADEDDDGNQASAPMPANATKVPPPYKATGPAITDATKAAILKLTQRPDLLRRLDDALTARNVLTLGDLSETDAIKLLAWLTSPNTTI